MATRILPHNAVELWQAQIDLLGKKTIHLEPDFPQGGVMDASEYDDGRGKVEVRARIKKVDDKHVVISEIPYGTTTESLIASIEAAAQKNRVKVSTINDYTTDKVEIEITLARGVSASEAIPQLYAYTDCSVSLSSNIVVVKSRRPVELTVTEILTDLTTVLREQIKAELEWESRQLTDRKHWLTLEQIFVEKRVYKRIEKATTQEAVRAEVVAGMKPHAKLFVRPMVDDDVGHLLELRIRRISAYDIEKNRKDISDIDKKLKGIATKLKHLTRTTIQYLEDLIEKFGDAYPRRTHVDDFEEIDVKAVARQNVKLSYDRESGFFGSAIKGKQFQLNVSEFDLILGIAADGTYRIMTTPEKVLFSGRLIYCEVFDPEKGLEFVLAYRDKAKIAWGKRVHILKFIRNKEYQLIKDRRGKVDLLLPPRSGGNPGDGIRTRGPPAAEEGQIRP